MIKVERLTKRYGETVAVDDISFEVEAGEILGFLGPNGAGKTTTMKVLTGFIAPTRGKASVGGYDIVSQGPEVRRRIGYLPEQNPLWEEMRVFDAIDFTARVHGMPRADRRRRVREMIDVCSLREVADRDIGILSKGFRQRVGLAQAMVHDPPVLVLDEPTSGLDPAQIVEIRRLVKDLGRKKTLILSTHILPEVQVTCDRVIIIARGRLAASGTPAELATRSRRAARIQATVAGPREEVKRALEEVPGVDAVRGGAEAGRRVRYAIEGEREVDVEDLAERVALLVSQRGWGLAGLVPEATTLEDVFLSLTTREVER